jgi:uncharacterized protein (DUF4415 family)
MRKIVRRIVKPAGTQADTAPSAPAPIAQPEDWTATPLPMPKGKRLISLRLDADLIDWFQQGGRGYQTRMNAVLRAWVEAQKRRH